MPALDQLEHTYQFLLRRNDVYEWTQQSSFVWPTPQQKENMYTQIRYNGEVVTEGMVTSSGVVEFVGSYCLRFAGGELVYECDLPKEFKVIHRPNVAIYDRITGERLHEGHLTSNGWEYAGPSHSEARFICVDQSYSSRYIDASPVNYIVDMGIETRVPPSFSELDRVPRTVIDGVYFVTMLNGDVIPAADAIYDGNSYVRLSDMLPNNSEGRPMIHRNRLKDDYTLLYNGRAEQSHRTSLLTAGKCAGQYASVYEVYYTADGKTILIDEAVIVCGLHGTSYCLEVPDDAVKIGERWVLPDAIVQCAATGENLYVNSAVNINGLNYSRRYAQEHAVECRECEEMFFSDNRDMYECECCRSRPMLEIRRYNNRTANFLNPERRVPIMFGIELEVGCDQGETQRACVNKMYDAMASATVPEEYAIFKRDGSLDDVDGFEVVTRPDCPSVHKRIFGKLLEDDLSDYMSSYDNGCCGIHIHVSRKDLSPLWIGRMLVLINSKEMYDVIRKVAGRGSNSYTKVMDKKLTDCLSLDGDRYEALNTTGTKTIEFRIFRGTLHRESFLKNIEFVEAVLEYTRPATRSLKDVDKPTKFVEFVLSKKQEYPNLYSFMLNRGLDSYAPIN